MEYLIEDLSKEYEIAESIEIIGRNKHKIKMAELPRVIHERPAEEETEPEDDGDLQTKGDWRKFYSESFDGISY